MGGGECGDARGGARGEGKLLTPENARSERGSRAKVQRTKAESDSVSSLS